jgi:hypothetical protein
MIFKSRVFHKLCVLLALSLACFSLAPSGPWDSFNVAPASRTLWPTAVTATHGSLSAPEHLVGGADTGSAILHGDSWVALDFGKEVSDRHCVPANTRTMIIIPQDQVGGHITLTISPSSSSASLSLAFTESPLFVGPISDDSSFPSANQSYDGALALPSPLPSGPWTMPAEKLRGGFRYLTIVSTSKESVAVSNVTVAIGFMPHWDDLRAYTGYFYADGQEILNKAWYAGVSNCFLRSQGIMTREERRTPSKRTLCLYTPDVRCHLSTRVGKNLRGLATLSAEF